MQEIKSYLDWANQGRSNIVLYIVGYVLTTLAFFALPMFFSFPLYKYFGNLEATAVGNLVMIFTPFLVPFLAIPLIVKILHNRPAWSVAMPKLFWGLKLMAVGFAIKMVLNGISFLYGYLTIRESFVYQGFDMRVYVPLVMVATVGIFIQASAEEVYFRGYLFQIVRRFTSRNFLILLFPALLFASRHMGNIESLGTNYLSVLPYFLHALMYGWVAIMTRSLWMPIGMHLANNLNTVAFVGIQGDVLTAHTPFVFTQVPLTNTVATSVIDLLLVYAIVSIMYKKSVLIQGGKQ